MLRRRLRDPRTVPTEPVEIDWEHPLAAGLDALFLPGLALTRELVGRWGPPGVNGIVSVSGASAGPRATFSGSSGSLYQIAPTNPQVYQMDAFFELPPGFVGPQVLCGMNQMPDGSTSSYDRILALDGSNFPNFYIYVGGAYQTVGGAALTTGVRHFLSAASDGTNLDLYADGALTATGTGGGWPNFSAPLYWLLGYSHGFDVSGTTVTPFSGALYAVARRTVPLNAADQAWLAAEPFAMLRPRR